jgi:LmbE family N-acetylglucosaminyl deacetylase
VSGRLAVVVAHPDDDTFGCSGTVAMHADERAFRFALIHVTSGEKGQIAEGSGATPATLGQVREEEDRRSWVALDREPDRHDWLRYPDHEVAEAPFDGLVDRIAEIFAQERPDVVITFGPDGITGHPDHIAVGAAATQAFHRARADDGQGFRRLLHQAIPQSMLDAWNEQLVAQGKEPMDPTVLYVPAGVPDDQIGIRVDCASVADRKVAAVREHVTQAAAEGEALASEDEQRAAMAFESHVIAWPPRPPGQRPLTDIFAGLD